MIRKFFIIGARGAGKTTLGRMAATTLGLSFVDTDELLARRWHEERADDVRVPGSSGELKRASGGQRAAEGSPPQSVAAELSSRSAVKLIPAIIESEGWGCFRRRESAALREAALHYTVISTGGGIVLAPENRAFMKESGVVVYLRAPAEVLAGRLKGDAASQRPSLTGLHPAEEMAEVLRAREPLYMDLADHVLDAANSIAAAMKHLHDIISSFRNGQ